MLKNACLRPAGDNRIEHDLLGSVSLQNSLPGIHTYRAVENFPITGRRTAELTEFICALGFVKLAAVRANVTCGVISTDIGGFIARAAEEIATGKMHEHFVVDIIQGGAGTSTNMNVNEVIANRALQLMGQAMGDYSVVHPLDHVNAGQSTNDVYPTAMKIGILLKLPELITQLKALMQSFYDKSEEFRDVIKVGRTQLQDAVPMTLGQEFRCFATSVSKGVDTIQRVSLDLLEVNMGGTAIGTGLNTPSGYSAQVIKNLSSLTGLDLVLARDLIHSTQDATTFVTFSSSLKALAVSLSKIANDLRLLSSGPRAGLGDISLPARQAGSSIMPGKVNPVIPEVLNQVAFRVMGHDLSVTLAAEAGQLQLNAMNPLIITSIFESMDILANALRTFRLNCVDGIFANREKCKEDVFGGPAIATALVPVLGYEIAGELAIRSVETGIGILDLLKSTDGINLSAEQIKRLKDPAFLTGEDPLHEAEQIKRMMRH